MGFWSRLLDPLKIVCAVWQWLEEKVIVGGDYYQFKFCNISTSTLLRRVQLESWIFNTCGNNSAGVILEVFIMLFFLIDFQLWFNDIS